MYFEKYFGQLLKLNIKDVKTVDANKTFQQYIKVQVLTEMNIKYDRYI
jgi:hypothetical protein